MIAMIAVGAAMGAVLFALVWMLVPRRPSLAVQLARFDARPVAATDAEGPESLARLRFRIGRALTRWLGARGITYPSLRRDLALTGHTLDDVMARKVVAFVTGFVLVIVLAVLVRAGTGAGLPAGGPALLGLGVGAGVFFLPDLREHQVAEQRRAALRRALGSWLDLVALEMAGSAAPAEALPKAARVGTTWPMLLLADTLYRATTAGQDHWDALTDLGQRTGISELLDLATLTQYVGRDGAQVRDTLTARAASLRQALLADIESQAGRADQSMLVAQVFFALGLIVFVMYAAVVNVLTT